jgi:general secretion pathway protein D
MHMTILRFVAVQVALVLAVSGCESLGGDPARKLKLPANLAIQRTPGEGEGRAQQTEPLGQEATRPPEYYPASGRLIGPGGSGGSGVSGSAGGGLPGGRAPSKEGKYTLNFDDADLSEVAKTILDETLHINYILSPKVTGKVTLQTTRPLSEDELIPTLEMLLRMNGAVLIRNGDVYRIEPDATAVVDAPGAQLGMPGQALPPGYQLRVIPLRYVGVQEMQKILEPLLPPKSIVRADSTRNIIMVAGSAEEMESVLETVRLFDVDFMRGMSVALFPLKNVEPGILAEELDKLLGDINKGPLAGLVKLLPIDRLNAILAVSPQPRYLDEVETWIERLDRYTTKRAGGVHVYRVQNVDAMELANTLSNIFGGGTGGRGGRPSLSPGATGSQIGGSYSGGMFGTGGAASGTGGSGLGSTAGDMDTTSSINSGAGGTGFGSTGGSSFGTGSSMGTSGGFGGSTAGRSGGFGGTAGGRSGGFGGGGFGGGGGGFGGSFGGGIGRGTGAQRGRGGGAADLGNARVVADPANNALIVTAKEQDWKEIEAVIKELDVLPLQVLIDATIAEVQLTDSLRYGIKWYFQQGSNAEGLGGVPGRNVLENVAAGFAASSPYAFHYSLVAAGKDVRILLSAEATKNKVNILSSPSLMVLNNQEAAIKVGDQVPILTGQFGGAVAGGGLIGNNPALSTFSSIQYRDTGVLLTVRPRVNNGGLVLMDLEQAVDDVSQKKISGIDSPIITQRQIKSSVAVRNGETLVLGGLIKDQSDNSRSGIPLLHDLPLLGDLFGSTAKSNNRTELVVLLTPRVVESQRNAREITNEFRRKLTGLYELAPERTVPPARRWTAPLPQ